MSFVLDFMVSLDPGALGDDCHLPDMDLGMMMEWVVGARLRVRSDSDIILNHELWTLDTGHNSML